MISSARKWVFVVLACGALLSALFAYQERRAIRDAIEELTKPSVPTPVPYVLVTSTVSPTISASATPAPTVLASINLDVPFLSQAPHMVWDADHEEFCEEASTLMAASYITGDHSVTDPDVAEAGLQRIKTWELATFGYFKDTTAGETARILREYFSIAAVQVVADPTEAQIKAWVAQGKVVLVPAAGRQLGNPNFKSPGPLYHMLVIKGYTAGGRFITNDAGTRKGADYIYDASVVMNAMHDWNGGDVDHGAKVVIVVG